MTFCVCLVVSLAALALPHSWIYGLAGGLISAVAILIVGPRLDEAVRQEIREGTVPMPKQTQKVL